MVLPSALCVICDIDVCGRAGWAPVDFATACLDVGARFLQVRGKLTTGRTFLDVSSAIVERARGAGALVVINDRADIARMAGAGGVHVGQDDLPPAAIRTLTGQDLVIGLSTHTPAQLDAGAAEPVTYLALGPVFGTATKVTGNRPVGIEGVRLGARRVELPLVAIGGITLANAPAVIEAGAQAVAVISDLITAADAPARVREYLAALS